MPGITVPICTYCELLPAWDHLILFRALFKAHEMAVERIRNNAADMSAEKFALSWLSQHAIKLGTTSPPRNLFFGVNLTRFT